MNALILILALCCTLAASKCPKTSVLSKNDADNSQDITIARVESCSENGGTIDCKLYHKSYLKTYSIYFYFPEIIKIPKNCKTTLQAGQDYVLGYTYSYSNFYYYNFARPVNGLTGDERGFLGM